MTAHLEVWKTSGVELVLLGELRMSIGRGEGNDVPLLHDRRASGVHAMLEPVAGGWCLQDLGSRNGTYVGGQRITGMRALRPGDEITIGATKIVFRTAEAKALTHTVGQAPPPELTRRERDVLRELCRPLFRGEVYAEAASVKEIADALWVTPAAVQQHLLNLYDKFGIHDATGRRGQLAREALRRGAVSATDYREASS